MTMEHDVFLVPSQFSSIQEAIAAIVRPSTIMVSPGVYCEDLFLSGRPGVVISTVRFGRRGVTLVGATADVVVHIENASVYISGIEIRSNGRRVNLDWTSRVYSLLSEDSRYSRIKSQR